VLAVTVGCAPVGEGAFASETLVAEADAVPVPMLAVQCGDAGTPREELVALALVAPPLVTGRLVTVLLVTVGLVTEALAARPVPMAADQ
jgi:hypothetical protein